MDLEGRVAVVTGAAVRVGRAIALGLADAGADVFVHYGASRDAAEGTAAEIEGLGVRAAVGSVDLASPENAAQVIDLAEASLGPVSLLVNSASRFPVDTIQDVEPDAWQQTIDLTLSSSVFVTQAFANRLAPDLDRRSGQRHRCPHRRHPNSKHFSYVVAKGGIDTFTRAAAIVSGTPESGSTPWRSG